VSAIVEAASPTPSDDVFSTESNTDDTPLVLDKAIIEFQNLASSGD
jgi:hypothetical protein